MIGFDSQRQEPARSAAMGALIISLHVANSPAVGDECDASSGRPRSEEVGPRALAGASYTEKQCRVRRALAWIAAVPDIGLLLRPRGVTIAARRPTAR